MALAPVDYGPQIQADNEGLNAMQQATAQHEVVFKEAHNLGQVIEGGSLAVAQGILHTQSLKATAAVKEKQASTLQFIDSNPYVPKAVLQQRMSPDDYTAWHAGLSNEYKDAQAVPMFTAAGALFDSEAKQARAEAGQIISLPGWRNAWGASEQTESATIRERYVNRLAADQMIADHRAQSLMAIDKMVDSATNPADLDTAAKAAATNPWLKPAERRFTQEKVLVAKDSFVAKQAMLAGDTEVMHAEMTKLKADNSAELYPNMNVKQRLDLANQLTREYGFKAAKDVAEKEIVGPNVDENGKVNFTGIEQKLAAYKGPLPKEAVVQAVKAEADQRNNLFDAKMKDVQHSIYTAGLNPQTAEFSYAQAMKNPEARKAAGQLAQDAPGLLTALGREDARQQNVDARLTRAEQLAQKAQLVLDSQDNLDNIHRMLDDPAQSSELRKMTQGQFDSKLLDARMTEPDRQKARAAFAQFQKVGKPDERAASVVNSEISAAANGDVDQTKKWKSKFGDALTAAAHAFIRANSTLPPDQLTDALRAHIREKMLSGDVINPGWHFNDHTKLIDWETNPAYAGKSFRTFNGKVIDPSGQKVHLTSPDGKQAGWVDSKDAADLQAKGWK